LGGLFFLLSPENLCDLVLSVETIYTVYEFKTGQKNNPPTGGYEPYTKFN